MVRSSLALKWSKLVPFCGMNHQKSNFLLISGTLSFGGCWGQPELPFWKLIDETQMSTPFKATEHQNATKLWFFYPSEPFSFVHFNMIHPVQKGSIPWTKTQIQLMSDVLLLRVTTKAQRKRLSTSKVFSLYYMFCDQKSAARLAQIKTDHQTFGM